MAFGGNKDSGESIFVKAWNSVKEYITPDTRYDSLVKALAERQAKKESEALVSLMDLISKQETDVRKLKPDAVVRDSEGKIVSENYTEAGWQALNKARERLEKLNKALTKGMAGDMKDVYDIVNQSGGKNKDGGKQEGSGEQT